MSKDRNKLVHIHSSQLNRQPKPEALVPGELAVNNFSGGSAFDGAFISTKNSADKVVRFSEDRIIANWIENKEVFPYSGNVDTITTQNRLDNKSKLVIHLNQAPAGLSPEHSAVTQTDGVYFKIDMDDYAIISGNPSFSSITSTCGTHLSGSTYITGADGGCGSLLAVDVDDVTFGADDFGVSAGTYGVDSDSVNIVSNDVEVNSSDSIVANTNALSVSGDSATIKENTVDVSACTQVSAVTNNFTVSGCDSSAVTKIYTCGGIELKTDDLKFSTCSNTGKTTVQACGGYKINSNDTQIVECDPNGKFGISATTSNISGTTLNVKETNSTVSGTNLNVIESLTDIKSSTTNISGDSLNVKEERVDVSACAQISAVTDNFVISACTNTGKTTVHSCGEVAVQSNKVGIEECNTGGTFDVSSSAMTMSGSNYTVKASKSICEATSGSANFAGSASTVIGIDCSSAFTSTTTQVVGKQIHVSATTSAITMSGKTAISGMAPEIRFSASTVDVDADMTLVDGLGLEVIETNHIATKAPSTVQIGSALTIYDNTIDVSACTRIYNTTDDFKVMGCSEDATASIEACGQLKLKTDELILETCSSAGTTNIAACGGLRLDSNDFDLYECDPGGTFDVRSSAMTLSGSSVVFNTNDHISGRSRNVEFRGTDNATIYGAAANVSGANVTVSGTTSLSGLSNDITLSGTSSISGLSNNIVLSGTSSISGLSNDIALKGTNSVSGLSRDISFSGSNSISGVSNNIYLSGATTNIVGNDIVISASTNLNEYSNHIVLSAATDIVESAKTITESGGTITTRSSANTNVYAENNLIESARTVAISGYDGVTIDSVASGANVCISSKNNVNVYGSGNTNVGISCGATPKTSTYVNIKAVSSITENTNILDIDAKMTAIDGVGFELNETNHMAFKAPAAVVSGSIMTVKENTIDVSACTHIYNTTDDFKIMGCTENGKVTIDDAGSGVHVHGLIYPYSGLAAQLAWKYGPIQGEESGSTNFMYDDDETIVIPSRLDHMDEFNGTCFEINHDICMWDATNNSGSTITAKAFYNKSDENIKENIKPISADALEKSDNVEFKEFNFKNTDEKAYGVIAQEVEKAGLNELVHDDAASGIKSVDYISLLVLKVAKLESMVEKLTKEINDLKAEK